MAKKQSDPVAWAARAAAGGVHALADADDLPAALKQSEGQARDGRAAAGMFGTVQARHILLADRADNSDALRDTLSKRGAWGNIRLLQTRKNHPAFSDWLSCQRIAVERFFNKLKYCRAAATRYGKRDGTLLAPLKLASLRIWRRSYGPVTWSAFHAEWHSANLNQKGLGSKSYLNGGNLALVLDSGGFVRNKRSGKKELRRDCHDTLRRS